MTIEAVHLHQPPAFCQYSAGPCDQSFQGIADRLAFFIYPSDPPQIAATIEQGVASNPGQTWQSWKSLSIAGQVIFCEVCKAMRFGGTVVADVTTLNFNVMFEIGFAIGLGLAVVPIRDTTYGANKRDFEELGVLDTLGYLDFTNVDTLVSQVRRRLPATTLPSPQQKHYQEAPLYVLKGPIDTQGVIQLLATIRRSRINFRAHDPIEVPRLSLGELRRQVQGSLGVVGHLLAPDRTGSLPHNALCALAAGMAMAQQKPVLLLQEEKIKQPVDYRDVAVPYTRPDQIPSLIQPLIAAVVDRMQSTAGIRSPKHAENRLLKLDLGDVAAENEAKGLDSYFVETAQFLQARQGYARLVIGRKGSGKTAVFYGIVSSKSGSPSRLVLDLKPEGTQFIKLREFLLSRLSPGLQEHTMVGFWYYILISELAARIITSDRTFARRDPTRFLRYTAIERLLDSDNSGEQDFSQRLLQEVERIEAQANLLPEVPSPESLTGLVFKGNVTLLESAVAEYLSDKEEVWLLVDNIDKGWPLHGSTPADILIVRSLLEATRKLQKRFESHQLVFRSLVFLRTDIHLHLLGETPDKGKDTVIRLDWDDPQAFEELVRRRIQASIGLTGNFLNVWRQLSDSHTQSEDTFSYIVERTLMRPRDLLLFLRGCLEVSINRGHARIEVDDILQAEKGYSEDLLLSLTFEIADTRPDLEDMVWHFQGAKAELDRGELEAILSSAGLVPAESMDEVIEVLIRFGFLGVKSAVFPEPTFSHDSRTT